MQYLYLLCLQPPSAGQLAQTRIDACYDAVSSLIVDAPDAGELIGHIRDDGTCEVRDMSALDICFQGLNVTSVRMVCCSEIYLCSV